MTEELGIIVSVIETGGALAGVLLGGGGMLLAMRWILTPTLQRLHSRMDSIEKKLDEARDAGAREHKVIGERVTVLEQCLRNLQQMLQSKK